MDREALERELAELEARNEAAVSWGAAVGARHERIKAIRSALDANLPTAKDVRGISPVSHAQQPRGWRDDSVAWLREQADIMTNSLHCGDNSATIQTTHNRASQLLAVANYINELAPSRTPAACSRPSGMLPDCMMPDGADPCIAFTEIYEEVKQLRAQVKEVDAWLAKAADQLNITPIMQAMDLGNEITQWRLARQKHSSTVEVTDSSGDVFKDLGVSPPPQGRSPADVETPNIPQGRAPAGGETSTISHVSGADQ